MFNRVIQKSSKKQNSQKRAWHFFLKKLHLAPKLKSSITKAIDYSYRLSHIKWNGIVASLDLSNYDFIHFHFVTHICQFRNTYPHYKGKTILTSHTPCPWTYEIFESDHSISYLKPLIIEQECKAYKSTDFLMFPCKYAKEPYEHDRRIRLTLNSLSNRTFYVPTSILSDENEGKTSVCRNDFNIPDNAFIIAFFGRHNLIKGYDILKDVAKCVLDSNPDIYFLCAGTGDIDPLIHPRWKELGFVSNIKELMKICDLYILPNRDTYFDIVTLEVLRSGMLLLASRTGGNKYFEQLPKSKTSGIIFFNLNETETIINHIFELIKLKREKFSRYNELKAGNFKLFKENFLMEHYVEKYLNELSLINHSTNKLK